MGIGKNEFLKNIQIASEGSNENPLKSTILNNDFYINKKLGVILKKPAKWDFVAVKDFGKLKKDQILSDDFEPYKNQVWKTIGNPILIITKYGTDKSEYLDKFSPTITIFINHKDEIKGFYDEDETFENLVTRIAHSASQMYKDYKTIKEITPYEITKCNGFEGLWSFTFESIEHKKSFHCKTWTIILEQNSFIYSFNMIDSDEADEIEGNNFKEFVKSIKII